MKKRVLILGGGIAGMTAGIYCLQNGFDVAIYEKHYLPGGQCTGWFREGTYIDGCAHWIIGTDPKSELFPSWKNIGAFDENTKIYPADVLSEFEIPGKRMKFYGDLALLQKELISIAPEDKKRIRSFIKAVEAYKSVYIPMEKPIEEMPLKELIPFGKKMLPMVKQYLKYKGMSMKRFASSFRSEILRDIFLRVLKEDYNVHSLLYILQAFAKGDTGVPEGGSFEMANRIKQRFIGLGGELQLCKEVKHIVVEGGKVKGVIIEGGEIAHCDYLISSVDAHHLYYDLLNSAHPDPFFAKKFSKPEQHPLNLAIYLSFQYKKDATSLPRMVDFPVSPYEFHGMTITHIPLRNYAFDPTLPNKNGGTLFTVLLHARGNTYDSLAKLNPNEYVKEKDRLCEDIKALIVKYLGCRTVDLEVLDCATPLTYQRYTNAYHGSYQSFICTKHNGKLMHSCKVKGIDNLFLCGQWLMSPGGLPIALFTGKHAAYYVSKAENGEFIDKDERSPQGN